MKPVLITGATDGIGRETARSMLQRGWRVLVHGRSRSKAERTASELVAEQKGSQAAAVWGDFSRMSEVVALSQQVLERAPRLDVLLNNAGVFEKRRRLTDDGLEMTMAVNHYAAFLLTQRVLTTVLPTHGRIVVVSSMAHQSGHLDLSDLTFERGYDGYDAYAGSKLANVAFTVGLAQRLDATKITANALHPGVITTKLLMAGFGSTGASVERGAQTSIYVATAPELTGVSGKYFSDSREARPSARSHNAEFVARLWQVSEELTGVGAI